jgi:hypothetical protein
MNETIFCGYCYRRPLTAGACAACGPVSNGIARRRADAVNVGDEVVEASGMLMPVRKIERLPRGMVRLHLTSFGASRGGELTARASREVSIAVKVVA